jgi:hypothetical protein
MHVIFAVVPPDMGKTGRYHCHVTNGQYTFVVTDPEPQCPRDNLESLFLSRMDMRCGHETTGLGIQITLEEPAIGVGGHLPPDHPLTCDRVIEHIPRIRHDRLLRPRSPNV